MVANIHELRAKQADTEKITINLGYVDLGQVDLMVKTDSIPTALISSGRPSATSSNGTRMS